MSWMRGYGDSWWEQTRRSDGKPYKRWGHQHVAPICLVAVCDDCGRTKNAIHCKKWWLYPWIAGKRQQSDFAYLREEPTLCMSCMNRHRPIAQRERDVRASKTLINALVRESKRAKAD